MEALGSNSLAALAMCRAVELDPRTPQHLISLERLLRRIPDDHAAAVQVMGFRADLVHELPLHVRFT